jgi:phospholipid N-methyltransferase
MQAHAPTAPRKTGFFREYLRDVHVAAVSPSSSFLTRRLLRALDLPATKLVIELGPGDGAATKPLLAALTTDARYVAIERNPNFAAALRGTDPRLTIVEGVAQDMERALGDLAGRADAVIASIPFTYLTKEERAAVCAAAKRMLRPGGTFVVFHQYSPLMVPYVKKTFGAVRVEFEPLNLFPCFLMKATKT